MSDPTSEWTGISLSRLINRDGYKGVADAHNAALAAARGTCDQCSRKLEDGQLFNDHQPKPTCTCNKENRGASQHSSHCLAANRPHQPKPTGEWTAAYVSELWQSGGNQNLADAHNAALADERERAYNKGRADNNTMYELAMRDNRKLDKEIQQLREQLSAEREKVILATQMVQIESKRANEAEQKVVK